MKDRIQATMLQYMAMNRLHTYLTFCTLYFRNWLFFAYIASGRFIISLHSMSDFQTWSLISTVFQSLFYLFVHSFIDHPWLAQAACWSDFPWLKKIFHPRASSPLPRPHPHPPLIMVSRLSGVLAARGPAGPQPVSQQEENEV